MADLREQTDLSHATPTPAGRIKRCPTCGQDHDQATLYCSKACKSRAASRRRRGHPIADQVDTPLQCATCGGPLAGRKHGARHCSEACQQRAAGRQRKGYPIADTPGSKACAKCGEEIPASRHHVNARFCSSRCSLNFHNAKHRNSKRPVLLRKCAVCGDDIPPTDRLTKKYCSADCRNRRDRSPEVVFRYVNARRARLAGASARPLPRRVLRRLRAARCTYCGGPGGTVDHLVPLSRGGQHSEGNLAPACRSCNSSKGDKLLIEWRMSR